MITQEHHGFPAIFVADIHQDLHQLRNLTLLEPLKILEFLSRNAVRVVVIALVDDILRTEPIARFPLKLLQNIGAHTGAVSEPVHKLFFCIFIEYQGKLMEKGSKADHIRIRVFHHPFFQLIDDMLLCLRLPHIKCDLVLYIFPAVGNEIIHMYRVPDDKGQETDRIIVITFRLCQNDLPAPLLIAPPVRRHDLSGRAVNNLPPAFDIIDGVGLQLLIV